MKSVTRTKVIGNDLSGLFDNLINGDRMPMDLVWPRFVEMRTLITKIIGNVRVLRDTALMAKFDRESIDTFLQEADKDITASDIDLEDYADDWSLMEDKIYSSFAEKYATLKKSFVVGSIVRSTENLGEYRRDFNTEEERQPLQKLDFINRIPGAEWQPFPFQWNLKEVMLMDGIGHNTYVFILTFIRGFYLDGIALWNKTQEPDIDVEKFSEHVTEAIEQLKTIPQLHRCRAAFAKIKDSIGLFKDNFNDYYRSFVVSRNQTTIMHEFIMDVSKTSNGDPRLTREFRTIVQYYKDMASKQANNPTANMIFDKIDKAFDMAEKDATGDKLRSMLKEDAIAARMPAEEPAEARQKQVKTEWTEDTRSVDELVNNINGSDSAGKGKTQSKPGAKPSAKTPSKPSAKTPSKPTAKAANRTKGRTAADAASLDA